MALNISRQELIEALEKVQTDLQELTGDGSSEELNLAELLDELDADEAEGNPRRRFEVSDQVQKMASKLYAIYQALRNTGAKYRTLKNGTYAPEPPKAVAVPKAGANEKVFKLSPAIRERRYHFPDGSVVSVPRPRSLTVKTSGNRELRTADGGRFVIHAGYERYSDVR